MGDPGVEGPGADREGRTGRGRGGAWTVGGGSAGFVGGVCGPQKPLFCSELARPLPLSLGLSFLTCKQDSKSLKATPRPLSSWYQGSGCEQRQGSPMHGPAGPGAPERWAHMLVVSSQVGPPGSRMEGVARHWGSCTQGCPASGGHVPGRGR